MFNSCERNSLRNQSHSYFLKSLRFLLNVRKDSSYVMFFRSFVMLFFRLREEIILYSLLNGGGEVWNETP